MTRFPQNSAFTDRDRIQVLLEEYRALYGVLTLRLEAMDRRLPVATATIAALLGATTAMPPATKLAFLCVLPIGLFWLVLTTVAHARAKEDHLRRIDAIERQVNQLAGEELLVFQSRHPNKHESVAGRSGGAAVLAVFSACGLMLAACSYLFSMPTGFGSLPAWIYSGYAAVCVLLAGNAVLRLSRYRYQTAPPSAGAPFAVHRVSYL